MIETTIKILIGVIAFIHILFLIMQMFFWDTDFVQKKLLEGLAPAEVASILARNQGLYNGFLAAGLIWGLYRLQTFPQVEPVSIWIFFLICIVIAGIYGSFTLKRPTAFLLQSLPAALALLLLWLHTNGQI